MLAQRAGAFLKNKSILLHLQTLVVAQAVVENSPPLDSQRLELRIPSDALHSREFQKIIAIIVCSIYTR
tara:strand:- start:248 stop:454 length:207 start_codon:yes stop_codon:yes gene_type:complete